MRDHLRPVRLFGRDYFWHREPGRPLELLPLVPLPEPPAPTAAELYESAMRMMGGALPWPEEEPGA
ncbi:hypothetical protein OG235_27985 [Streptomyces sp. NBC_00024]|uniref:hypothetical protein n=1 Tax=Streptomyces sp. NBC_00024 TaxID=2903612 RepID=UPI003248EDA8